ncbi:ferritin-like protein [Streptomyces sp. NPDC088921]|uniref:ferritin-like domain-containing protein n=1 Tax=unclassified Streptomyces TaxID=2593676 RepID=UPI0034247CA7
MTKMFDYESNGIVELMTVPAEERGAQWLMDALQNAIMLELATLPPYLCGLWSIKDSPDSTGVAAAINEIVFDEMSHLGLVCNMLTTIGGTPRLADENVVPKYPGPLPGGVRHGLTVYLSGLTKNSIAMYSKIEQPEDSVVQSRDSSAPEDQVSIGAFYSDILNVFANNSHLIRGTRQVVMDMSFAGKGNSVVALTSLSEVEGAIKIIKEQGEGTSASPDNPFPGEPGELAHFYVFREIHEGRRLIETPAGPNRFDFVGDEIPMPDAFPMGMVPEGGWAGGPRELLERFNTNYSSLLRLLEQAWQAEEPSQAEDLLFQAVDNMSSLRGIARELMGVRVSPDSDATYGPEFRYVDA